MAEAEAAVAAFKRIIDWVSAHKKAKAILPSLNQPATDAAIAEFEAKTKVKLPPGLAAIYRLHDGQDEGAANDALDPDGEIDSIESGLFPGIEGSLAYLLVPLEELAGNLDRTMPGFRKGWLPIGDNYGGDNIVIDLASEEPAKRGRVLQFNHEYGGAAELAKSFDAYLEHIADGLKSKKIKWDDEAGLSYARGRDWDDLIEKKKVEYDPKYLEEYG
jgi:cell wall assembly regulator SMI1